MKIARLLLAAMMAAVLLGALVSSASASRLSFSADSLRVVWSRLVFSGRIGNVECEAILNGTLHSRSITKTRRLLMGYITAANVNRCTRGGATILREMLPWHVQYDLFAGTLPVITGIRLEIVGFALRIREPNFGIECLARSTESEPVGFILNINLSGTVVSANAAGETIRCESFFSGSFSGSASSTTDAGGARITVTLI